MYIYTTLNSMLITVVLNTHTNKESLNIIKLILILSISYLQHDNNNFKCHIHSSFLYFYQNSWNTLNNKLSYNMDIWLKSCWIKI